MTAPLLILRVGYMERYDGPDTITWGGAYIERNGVGGEVFNFKPSRGKCYGYAMSRHFAGVNLRHLDGSQPWREGDELSGVNVVFIARRPDGGQVVVGWYRNATVFHKQYRVRRGSIPGLEQTVRHFLCVADAESARLLPEDERKFDVPYAPAGFKGFPGQSNVWYPNLNIDQTGVAAFIRKLTKYIEATAGTALAGDEVPSSNGGKKNGRTSTPNHAHNAMVEQAAVDAVWAHYEADGYTLQSVEAQCLGWDLEAVKGKTSLRVEVKGTSGAAVYFELTPNEYAKLREHSATYRVCVVCEALTNPRIFELKPEASGNAWRLVSMGGEVTVPLMERIAAIGAEVAQDEVTA
jgi:hypothetical protein